jgi:hypothetical protein
VVRLDQANMTGYVGHISQNIRYWTRTAIEHGLRHGLLGLQQFCCSAKSRRAPQVPWRAC